MALISRDLKPDDAENYNVSAGHPPSAWTDAVESEFRALYATGGLLGASLLDAESGRCLGFLAGACISVGFSKEILSGRTPYPAPVAVDWIEGGRHPILSADIDSKRFADADSDGAGQHLHVFRLEWVNQLGPISLLIRSEVGRIFIERFIGLPTRMVTIVSSGQPHHKEAEATGFLALCRYEEYKRAHSFNSDHDPILYGADRARAEESGSSWQQQLFGRLPARIDLPHRYRRILYYARLGFSDAEIADRTFYSSGSMKTHWDRIYGAFDTVFPEMFSDRKQKRPAVLRYINAHPEECWPTNHCQSFFGF